MYINGILAAKLTGYTLEYQEYEIRRGGPRIAEAGQEPAGRACVPRRQAATHRRGRGGSGATSRQGTAKIDKMGLMTTCISSKLGSTLTVLILGLAISGFPSAIRAEIKLASLFSDHAVLQRDVNVPVWGWASPGDKVVVSFCGQMPGAVADGKGKWKVVLQPLRAGGPFNMTVTGKETIVVKDVLVGEVWLCRAS